MECVKICTSIFDTLSGKENEIGKIVKNEVSQIVSELYCTCKPIVDTKQYNNIKGT